MSPAREAGRVAAMQVVQFRRPVGQRKGRQVDPAASQRVRALLDGLALRRDLLIEHLHRIQDAEGCLPAPMLAALAALLRLSQAEVFEVASFYHHFDVVRDGDAPPATLTVRVCDSLSCRLAGAEALVAALAARLGRDVRVQRVPCIGRCAEAPAAVVGRRPVAPADVESVAAAVERGERDCPLPGAQDYAAYRAAGGYTQLARVLQGTRDRGSVLG